MLVLKIYWVFWWKLRLAFEIKTAKIGQSAPQLLYMYQTIQHVKLTIINELSSSMFHAVAMVTRIRTQFANEIWEKILEKTIL